MRAGRRKSFVFQADVGGESPLLRQNTTLQVDLRVVSRRVVSDLGDLFYDETRRLSCPISLALFRGVQLGRYPFADDLKNWFAVLETDTLGAGREAGIIIQLEFGGESS